MSGRSEFAWDMHSYIACKVLTGSAPHCKTGNCIPCFFPFGVPRASTRLRPSLVVLAPLLSHKMFKHESESPWVKFTCHHDGMVVFPRFIDACSAVRLAPLPSRISWPSCRYIYIYMTTHGVLQWSCTARTRPTKPPKRQKTKLVARTCACPGVQRFHQRAPCTQSAHGQDWFSVGHGQRPISWHSSPWSLATHFAK